MKRLISFIFGLGLLWAIVGNVYWGALNGTWPTTKGRITSSYVQPLGFLYQTNIEYEYQVNNSVFRSKRLSIDSWGHYELSRSKAESIVADYPINRPVDIFFDSRQPQRATLNLKFGRYTVEMTVFDRMIFLSAWILIFYGILGDTLFRRGEPPISWNISSGSEKKETKN